MPKIKNIITYINSQISTALNTERFQGAEYYNDVVELVPVFENETRRTYPAIVDHYGEGTSAVVDDTLPLQLYHRLIGIEYVSIPEDNYGDSGNAITETANMRMIVISDRNKIHTYGPDLLASILANIPSTLPSALLSSLNLTNVIIEFQSANTNMEEVFRDEYAIEQFELKPNSIMYAITYTIKTTFSQACFLSCD